MLIVGCQCFSNVQQRVESMERTTCHRRELNQSFIFLFFFRKYLLCSLHRRSLISNVAGFCWDPYHLLQVTVCLVTLFTELFLEFRIQKFTGLLSYYFNSDSFTQLCIRTFMSSVSSLEFSKSSSGLQILCFQHLPLSGRETLHLQGLQFHEDDLLHFSEVSLSSLSGNALL